VVSEARATVDLAPTVQDLYLDLLKRTLAGTLSAEPYRLLELSRNSRRGRALLLLQRVLASRGLALVGAARARDKGHDWPADAYTMIGLENVQHCVTDVIRRGVPGDLIETGVWRGGATIFMRGILKAYGAIDRTVWVADSFQGLPQPNLAEYPVDAESGFWAFPQLAVSLETVKANFERFGLLDDQVRFLRGWFKDTLPGAPIERLAVLRLDGDMYESTMDALRALYPKVSIGGYVIVDDYGFIDTCKRAVEDFRARHEISDRIEPIDETGVFWRRTR
jgi:O-methyltransferase